jgi:hypothetical protein
LSGEAEMRRINRILHRLNDDRMFAQINSPNPGSRVEKVDALIAEWQAKYDRLAGVPGAQ